MTKIQTAPALWAAIMADARENQYSRITCARPRLQSWMVHNE